MSITILYEDNHLIAVAKPAGQLTQPDKTGKAALLDEVKAFIKERDQKPGNVFIGLLHRLDRPVGGVVLFAKTSKAAARISEQIRERTISKTYEALVEGTPPAGGTVRQWLVKDKVNNRVHAHNKQTPGGLYAELTFKLLFTSTYRYVDVNGKPYGVPVSRVAIKPITGRPHQIRVAMASLGTPILGDKRYGAKQKWQKDHIALHATALAFNHPITQERIEVRSEPSGFNAQKNSHID
ncbi:MAG: RluA family pseudouridine synthase [Candidatus Sungbacteria bacterium]|nr:RluA family pseudouridine synthase [Candidatus Sungbacteria bacterium]